MNQRAANDRKWICVQLGAREHYAVPRALRRVGSLELLVTDAWVPRATRLGTLPVPMIRRMADRFHPELKDACVQAFTVTRSLLDVVHRIRGTSGWDQVLARNLWFQKRVCRALESYASKQRKKREVTIFAYSYAALEVFKLARSMGWRTALGQIDAGPFGETILMEERVRRPDYSCKQPAPPADYWRRWTEECELADHILVNSQWCKAALESTGIPAGKISTVPLVYEPSGGIGNFERIYPRQFSGKRPLRVLFLGRLSLQKGIASVLEAAELLQGEPVEFWIVGPEETDVPSHFRKNRQLQWIGAVPRSLTGRYFRDADVFLFPTLSDGFGITQLEAHSWKLPVIASTFCGDVVDDNVTGLLLSEVSGDTVAAALRRVLKEPERLQRYSESCDRRLPTLEDLATKLTGVDRGFV